MKKTDALRRIVSLLLILTLISSFFVTLLLSVSAEDEGLQGGQSNIVNGGFEVPENYRIDALNASSTTGYKYVPQGEVTGWKTTATTSTIEIGWLNKDGTSPHMIPKVLTEISGNGPADGFQFAETIANETSTIYQSLSVTAREKYVWTVNHRGRSGVDTLAVFIVDDADINYVKAKKTESDHFNKIVAWMKRSGVTEPAAGDKSEYTVYTTALLDNGAFHDEASNNYISFTPDKTHTVRFQICLMSTEKTNWLAHSGTYRSDGDHNILFAITAFKSASAPSSSTSGNLVDKISFSDSLGRNLLANPGFEDFEAPAADGYYMANAANSISSAPTANIGWSTTASDYKIEIGTLRGGKDAYGLGATLVVTKPSIREGDQFAELNADQESSLYQIVDTVPGKMYKWSLSHRGRSGLDTMALIIGPAQYDEQGNSLLPQKTSASARDQLMQIVDWLYSQTEMAIDIPKQGCSEKIKLYSPKFDNNNNGGWAISENIFSWQKDTAHTEEWSVWIISSANDQWHDYGELEENATYDYNYIVPNKQEQSIFGFVSHNANMENGTKNPTYGNLLDNIAFKEYFYAKVEVSMNKAFGSAYINPAEDHAFVFDEEHIKEYGWALAGSSFTVHVKTELVREFLGAYINGTFVPVKDGDTVNWVYDEDNREYTYTFHDVQSAIKVNIIFTAKQIYYDSRSKHIYQYDGPDSGPEVQMNTTDRPLYVSHKPVEDDGWKFICWKYISLKDSQVYKFEDEHTVELISDASPTFRVYDSQTTVSGISYDEGITFLAEWKYRQRAIAKTFIKEENQYVTSAVGGTVDINVSFGDAAEDKADYLEGGEAVGEELYASAEDTYITVSAYHNKGYAFNGWYDKDGNLVSRNTNYAYKVPDGDPVELYAYFEPYGLNLTIDCDVFGDSEDLTQYFKVNCTFSNLRANQLYIVSDFASDTETIMINGERVYNPTTIRADENGEATTAIYMKHNDSGTFVFLPENCVYTIQADRSSPLGFSVRGEVASKVLTEETNENLLFYKVSQSTWIKDGKHYEGIAPDAGLNELLITKNSSYTFQVQTKYTPSLYGDLNASLCFYNAKGIQTDFAANTRILMIDLTVREQPRYYSYAVAGQTSAIALTDFTELGTASNPFALPTGSMVTENLVFVVDYVDAGNAAVSGKVALVYDDSNSELIHLINPTKKAVNIGDDTTGITAEAVGNGNAARGGPFAIHVTVSKSTPAVNTTYMEHGESVYSVLLSVEGDRQLPDGSYAVVDGRTYYSNNGTIKITPLLAGEFNVIVVSPVPFDLTNGNDVTFKATLMEAVGNSPDIPKIISDTVPFLCADVSLDAEVVDKVLNPENVSAVDITLKHSGVDEVKLTISRKNPDQTLSAILENIPVNLRNDENPFAVPLEDGFDALSGETYMFTFVGYSGNVPVIEDTCCVVGGYISQ